jgi:hypothetical protein
LADQNFKIKKGLTVGSSDVIDENGAATFTSLTAASLSYPSSDGTSGQVLTTNGSGTLTFQDASGGISNLAEDTTPQLGGNLDVLGHEITSSTGNVVVNDRLNLKSGITTLLDVYDAAGITGIDSPSLGVAFTAPSFSFNGGTTNPVSINSIQYPTSDGTAGQVLTTDGSGTLTFADASGGISNVVEDTTPELGGTLDVNGFGIWSGYGNSSINLPATTGVSSGVTLLGRYNGGTGTTGTLTFYGTQNGFGDGNVIIQGNNNASGSGNVYVGNPSKDTVRIQDLIYPSSDGTAGQVLTTDGAGNLSFADASGGISSVVEDTTPQLGGNLDTNGKAITRADGNYIIGSNGLFVTIGNGASGGLLNIRGGTAPGTTFSGLIRLYEDDDTNYVALKAPSTIANNTTFVLPSADGSNGQVLTTDGSGNLSFADASGGIASLVEDTTPQLGGSLDAQNKQIYGVSTLSGNPSYSLNIYGTNTENAGTVNLRASSSYGGTLNVGGGSSNTTTLALSSGSLSIQGLNWPNGSGSIGQALTTNGSGDLYWDTAGNFSTTSGGYSGVSPVASGVIHYSNAYDKLVMTRGRLVMTDDGDTPVEIRAGSMTGAYTLVLPPSLGTDGQVLTLVDDGFGNITSEFADASGGISSLIEDTSPQLGGSLDVGYSLIYSSNNYTGLLGSNSGVAGTISISGNQYANGNGAVYIQGANGSNGTHNVYISAGGNNGFSYGDVYIGSDGSTYTNNIYINDLLYPSSDGTNGQVLTTDGAGNLSFADAGGGATSLNELSDAYTDAYSNLGLGHTTYNFSAGNGYRNIAIGQYAGDSITTGDDNVAIGYNAATNVTTGGQNIAIGRDALNTDSSVLAAIAIGYYASEYYPANYTVAVGYHANRYGYDDTDGVYIGSQAGYGSTSYSGHNYNTHLGHQTGYYIYGGDNNTMVGRQAGYNVNNGTENTFLGSSAGFGTSANYSTFVGVMSGQEADGTGNTALGHGSGRYLDGQYNVAIGHSAFNAASITGNYNIGIGYNVDTSATNVSNELTFGANAGNTGQITRLRIPGMGLDSGTATSGQVLTANGSGGASFQDAAGGGSETAGQILMKQALYA